MKGRELPLAKKKKEVKLEVVGGNATGVTGSCTKIEFFGRTILFELGMVQDNSTILANYKDNCAIMRKKYKLNVLVSKFLVVMIMKMIMMSKECVKYHTLF